VVAFVHQTLDYLTHLVHLMVHALHFFVQIPHHAFQIPGRRTHGMHAVTRGALGLVAARGDAFAVGFPGLIAQVLGHFPGLVRQTFGRFVHSRGTEVLDRQLQVLQAPTGLLRSAFPTAALGRSAFQHLDDPVSFALQLLHSGLIAGLAGLLGGGLDFLKLGLQPFAVRARMLPLAVSLAVRAGFALVATTILGAVRLAAFASFRPVAVSRSLRGGASRSAGWAARGSSFFSSAAGMVARAWVHKAKTTAAASDCRHELVNTLIVVPPSSGFAWGRAQAVEETATINRHTDTTLNAGTSHRRPGGGQARGESPSNRSTRRPSDEWNPEPSTPSHPRR
jgi:hypothetical protein